MLHNMWALPLDMAENVLRHLFSSNEKLSSLPSSGGEQKNGYSVHSGIALIGISLPITRSDMVSSWSGERLSIGQDSIRQSLMAAYADVTVKSILLVINSPGGVVHGTKELSDFIANSPKTIATYVDGLCTSAAFWLASATGRIFSPQTGTVGSVGVIQLHADFSRYYDKLGVTFTPITAGTYKAVGIDSKALSHEDISYLQKHITAVHNIFKSDVKKGLTLNAPEKDWGEAQVFLADEALSLGLISQVVQDVQEVIQILNKELHMDAQTLATEHPQLLAQIQSETAKAAEEQATVKLKAEHEQAHAALFAVVKACVGEKAMTGIENMLEQCQKAQLSDVQIVALAPTLATSIVESQPEQSNEQTAMQSILKNLQVISPDPLAADPKQIIKTQGKSALVLDAENRAHKGYV